MEIEIVGVCGQINCYSFLEYVFIVFLLELVFYIILILIGNFKDIMVCVFEMLVVVWIIVCEDMWIIVILIYWFGLKMLFLVYYEYNVDKQWLKIMVEFEVGYVVVLVFDVGMLLVFDFGFWFVCDVVVVGYKVILVFGVLVLLVGLVVLGLFSDMVLFVGFLL